MYSFAGSIFTNPSLFQYCDKLDAILNKKVFELHEPLSIVWQLKMALQQHSLAVLDSGKYFEYLQRTQWNFEFRTNHLYYNLVESLLQLRTNVTLARFYIERLKKYQEQQWMQIFILLCKAEIDFLNKSIAEKIHYVNQLSQQNHTLAARYLAEYWEIEEYLITRQSSSPHFQTGD